MKRGSAAHQHSKDDVFHSHGFAKVAYGHRLGSASPVPGSGRAGANGGVGAVGSYRHAGVMHRHPHAAAKPAASAKDNAETGSGSKRRKHPDKKPTTPSAKTMPAAPPRMFREPKPHPFNPYR